MDISNGRFTRILVRIIRPDDFILLVYNIRKHYLSLKMVNSNGDGLYKF